MPPVSILLVDDNARFLDSVERFITAVAPYEIAGRALSGQEALARVGVVQPDLVLMDLAMPGMNGLEATRAIKTAAQPPRVIIMTMYDTPEYRVAAGEAGADGFVIKSEFAAELLPLIARLFEDA